MAQHDPATSSQGFATLVKVKYAKGSLHVDVENKKNVKKKK